EAYYANEYGITVQTAMREMWLSLLWGGFGHIYGNAPQWYFGDPSSHASAQFADQGGLDWLENLDDLGASYLTYVGQLIAARDLSALTPDYSHNRVTSGYGSEGLDYAPVLYGSDRLVAFTPGSALTIAKGQFSNGTYQIRWFNPRAGGVTDGGTEVFA